MAATKKSAPAAKANSDEKFIVVHLTKSKTGASVMNSKGFATAVKLEQHVKSLAGKSARK
jgi:hypothetical protein